MINLNVTDVVQIIRNLDTCHGIMSSFCFYVIEIDMKWGFMKFLP